MVKKNNFLYEISNNRLIKIDEPRSDSDKDQYNKLIYDIIFNDNSNQINASYLTYNYNDAVIPPST